jgi:hypothetical protein
VRSRLRLRIGCFWHRLTIELLAGLPSDEAKIFLVRVFLKFLQSLSARSSRRTKLQSAEIQPRLEFKLLVAISERLAENGLQRLCGRRLLATTRIHFGSREGRNKLGRAITGMRSQSYGIGCSSLGVFNF